MKAPARTIGLVIAWQLYRPSPLHHMRPCRDEPQAPAYYHGALRAPKQPPAKTTGLSPIAVARWPALIQDLEQITVLVGPNTNLGVGRIQLGGCIDDHLVVQEIFVRGD